MIGSIVVAACSALGILLIVGGLSQFSRQPGDVLEARLQHFGETGGPTSLTEVEMSLPLTERVFRPAFARLANTLAKRTPMARQQALHEKLNIAGRPYGLSVGGFLVLRLIFVVVVGLLGYALGLLMEFSGASVLLAPIAGAVVGYMLPEALLSRRVRRRQKEILVALPSAIDLLTISVEAGLAFDAAISRVTEKYKNALATEFNQTLNEIRLGRPRMEALDDMGRRNKVEELNTFCQAIIQSDQLGVGVANVLRIQSQEMRRRRRQRAEELGQKAALKMLFPMVGCIFPALFVVLLGPAAIIVSHQFGSGH